MFKDKSLIFMFLASLATVIAFPLISILFVNPTFTRLLIEDTEREAIHTANYLKRTMCDFQDDHLIFDERHAKEYLRNLLADFGVMKIKLFTKSGKTLFSTDAADKVREIEREFLRLKEFVYNRKTRHFTPVTSRSIVFAGNLWTFFRCQTGFCRRRSLHCGLGITCAQSAVVLSKTTVQFNGTLPGLVSVLAESPIVRSRT